MNLFPEPAGCLGATVWHRDTDGSLTWVNHAYGKLSKRQTGHGCQGKVASFSAPLRVNTSALRPRRPRLITNRVSTVVRGNRTVFEVSMWLRRQALRAWP